MTHQGNNGGDEGFTLLETIIAFLILAMSLSVTVQTISSSGLTFRRASDLQRASFVMEELAAVQLAKLAKAEHRTGKLGQSSWSMTVIEVEDNYPGKLLAVDIEVRPRGDEGPVFDYITLVALGES